MTVCRIHREQARHTIGRLSRRAARRMPQCEIHWILQRGTESRNSLMEIRGIVAVGIASAFRVEQEEVPVINDSQYRGCLFQHAQKRRGHPKAKDQQNCQRRKDQSISTIPALSDSIAGDGSPHAIAIACRSAPTNTTLPPARKRIRPNIARLSTAAFSTWNSLMNMANGATPISARRLPNKSRSPYRR